MHSLKGRQTDKKMDNYTAIGAVEYGAGSSNLHWRARDGFLEDDECSLG